MKRLTVYRTPEDRRPHAARCARAGLSLLEVMIATGVMAASAMVLTRLASIGSNHARRSETITEAILLAQNKIHGLAAGIEPLRPVEHQPFDENPRWEYSLSAEPQPIPGLWRIQIDLFRRTNAPAAVTPSSSREGQPPPFRGGRSGAAHQITSADFSLVQWIRLSPRETGKLTPLPPGTQPLALEGTSR